MYNLYVNVQGSRSYTIHFMVLCSMALLRQYMPPTAKWYFIPGRLSPAFFLTLLGEPHTDPDLSMDTTRQSRYILTTHYPISNAVHKARDMDVHIYSGTSDKGTQ